MNVTQFLIKFQIASAHFNYSIILSYNADKHIFNVRSVFSLVDIAKVKLNVKMRKLFTEMIEYFLNLVKQERL